MRALARLCLPLVCALSPATGGSREQQGGASPRPPSVRGCEQGARAATAEAARLRSEWARDSLRRAAAQLDAARRCWQLARDDAAQADALSMLGEVYTALEDWERARASYEAAARLRHQAGDTRGEAEAACALSRALTGLGDFDEAKKSAQSALDAAHTLSDTRLEARALSALGHAHYFGEHLQEARRDLERAAALAPPDDVRTRAETLLELGWADSEAGELERAFARFNEALPLWEKLGDPAGQARTLTALGRALTFRGELQNALEHHRRALRIADAAGDVETQAVAHNNIGYFHESLGQHERALEPFERALAGFTATGNRAGQAVTIQYVGNVRAALGERARARGFYERGLALSRAIKNPLLEAYALNNLGLLEQAEGRAVGALDNFRRAREIYERAGNRRGHAYALANTGFALETLGRRADALGSYERALALIVAAGDREGELFTRHNLARVLRDAGRLDEARAHCEDALELIERLRTKVSSQEHRTSYFASVHRHYELYVDVLMGLAAARPGGEEFAALALQTSERARARTLLETLAEVRAGIRQGVDHELADRQRALQLRIDEASSRQTQLLSGEHTEEGATAAARALRALLEEYEELRGEIRERSPRYAALVEPQPAGLAEVRQLLDDDTLLVEYSLGERRSFVWAVARDSFVARELPPRAEIEGAARGLLELLTARQSIPADDFAGRERRAVDADARYWREAGALSRMILAPVASELKRKKRLLVVADGALHVVPFDALPDPSRIADCGSRIGEQSGLETSEGGDGSANPPSANSPSANPQSAVRDPQCEVPLMIDHEIVNLPSVSTLAALRRDGPARVRAAGAVAVLADPVFETDDPRVRRPAPVESRQSAPQESRPATPESVRTKGAGPGGDSGRKRAPVLPSGAGALTRLPASRDEAEAIMSVVPAGAGLKITGFDATRAAALSPELARYRVVHFATHGLFDERQPELSSIVFSLVDETGGPRDGHLRLHDIYNLNLPVELVVLSACETGRGRDVRGEGLVGLTRGFMYAGAGGVVASLWKVDDEATAELMRHFYRGLLRESLSPAAALRAARIAVWRERRWRAPYYWAAFVLQGEYGEPARSRGVAAAARGGRWKYALGGGALLAFFAVALYALKRRRRKNFVATVS